MKQVQSDLQNPLSLLHSSDSEEADNVLLVRVYDKGSDSYYAQITLDGISDTGVVDSVYDITILGGKLFESLASVARKEEDSKPRDLQIGGANGSRGGVW